MAMGKGKNIVIAIIAISCVLVAIAAVKNRFDEPHAGSFELPRADSTAKPDRQFNEQSFKAVDSDSALDEGEREESLPQTSTQSPMLAFYDLIEQPGDLYDVAFTLFEKGVDQSSADELYLLYRILDHCKSNPIIYRLGAAEVVRRTGITDSIRIERFFRQEQQCRRVYEFREFYDFANPSLIAEATRRGHAHAILDQLKHESPESAANSLERFLIDPDKTALFRFVDLFGGRVVQEDLALAMMLVLVRTDPTVAEFAQAELAYFCGANARAATLCSVGDSFETYVIRTFDPELLRAAEAQVGPLQELVETGGWMSVAERIRQEFDQQSDR
jgi:hypothetical protein